MQAKRGALSSESEETFLGQRGCYSAICRQFRRNEGTPMWMKNCFSFLRGMALWAFLLFAYTAHAQLVDNTQAPNVAKGGINKSLADEIGAGRGDIMTPGSSIFIIKPDPFRPIRRGRHLFHPKFTRAQGQASNEGDGVGDINTNLALGAGLADNCALCHSPPTRSAGACG